ncbi:MAG: DNA repair protein RecN [Vampirovibrio sp.]|nr:DNA repair protein RecN [Vampirovibrio sp.]
MITHLHLQNIAIVTELSVAFSKGLTVITGETGAGKSILLLAMGLAFGDKAMAKEILKTGATQGRVELTVETEGLRKSRQKALTELLTQHSIEPESGETQLLLSREFTTSAGRCRINGTPVPRQALADLKALLLSLHSQHETVSLFQPAVQRDTLDALGGNSVERLKPQVAVAYHHWQTLSQKLAELEHNAQEHQRHREFLAFQVQELEEAGLENPTEDEDCREQLDRLRHGESLLKQTRQVAGLLAYNEDPSTNSVSDLLEKAERPLKQAARIDPTLEPKLEALNSLIEETKHLAGDLHAYQEQVHLDPQAVQELVDRLDVLEKLKRKYGNTLTQVIETHQHLAQELAELDNPDTSPEKLAQQCQEAESHLRGLCLALRQERQETAITLTKNLTRQLQELALPHAVFEVAVEETDYTSSGADTVTFRFSANPGEPARSLAKVASGGELSRVLLGLKTLTAQADAIPTLVFDEIDTGISGKTVKAVAQKIKTISQSAQVLVITHQPIVAATGDHHVQVEKSNGAVSVSTLNTRPARMKALSQLASGQEGMDASVEKFVGTLLDTVSAT